MIPVYSDKQFVHFLWNTFLISAVTDTEMLVIVLANSIGRF